MYRKRLQWLFNIFFNCFFLDEYKITINVNEKVEKICKKCYDKATGGVLLFIIIILFYKKRLIIVILVLLMKIALLSVNLVIIQNYLKIIFVLILVHQDIIYL